MTRLTLDISMSLDGFVAGPNQTLEEPLGRHLAPVLLGGGVRLFDGPGGEVRQLEPTRVLSSPAVTHLRFDVP
jgi:hypothetical protein